MNGMRNVNFFGGGGPAPWGYGRGQKVKYHLISITKSISKIFIHNFVCVLTNFHSVARVMPRGGTCGCLGESKTLAWGFAMAPHRLRALVTFAFSLF